MFRNIEQVNFAKFQIKFAEKNEKSLTEIFRNLNLPKLNFAEFCKILFKKIGKILTKNEITELCKGVHRVDLGESFQTHISCTIWPRYSGASRSLGVLNYFRRNLNLSRKTRVLRPVALRHFRATPNRMRFVAQRGSRLAA